MTQSSEATRQASLMRQCSHWANQGALPPISMMDKTQALQWIKARARDAFMSKEAMRRVYSGKWDNSPRPDQACSKHEAT